MPFKYPFNQDSLSLTHLAVDYVPRILGCSVIKIDTVFHSFVFRDRMVSGKITSKVGFCSYFASNEIRTASAPRWLHPVVTFRICGYCKLVFLFTTLEKSFLSSPVESSKRYVSIFTLTPCTLTFNPHSNWHCHFQWFPLKCECFYSHKHSSMFFRRLPCLSQP